MKLAIVVPACNEEYRIGRTLTSYSRFFEDLQNQACLDYKIIIIINNTIDNTEGVVRNFMNINKNISFLNLKKGGKGYALIQGFTQAVKEGHDLIGFVDADMATRPEYFYMLVEHLEPCDCAIANRYMRGSKIFPRFSFRRIVVSRVFNFIVRAMFLISSTDTQCGAKLFKREAISKILPELWMTQWAIDVEILYKLRRSGFSTKDVNTVWYEVPGSNIDVASDSLRMLLAIIQLRLINSPFRGLIRFIKPLISAVYGYLRK
jgi:dolichol-phosphate mannosyltransferase